MKYNKILGIFMTSLILLSGCSKKTTDKFVIESDDYNFSLTTEDGKITEIIENGTTYSDEDIEIAQSTIDFDGINTLYEAMYYSVSLNDDAKITLNGKDYSEIRKETYSEYLDKTKCVYEEENYKNTIEFVTKDGIINGEKITYEYVGDYEAYTQTPELTEALKSNLIDELKDQFMFMTLNEDKVSVEVEGDHLLFIVDISEEDLSNINNDLITSILTLENENYICE